MEKKQQLETIKISTDKGLSWFEKEVDIREINPDNTILKEGYWIEKDNKQYEIKTLKGLPEELKNNTMINGINKFKGLLYASVLQ